MSESLPPELVERLKRAHRQRSNLQTSFLDIALTDDEFLRLAFNAAVERGVAEQQGWTCSCPDATFVPLHNGPIGIITKPVYVLAPSPESEER